MDPSEGDVALERLRVFVEHAGTENEPSDEGWHLFVLADEAFDSLAAAYEATGPKHLAEPADQEPMVAGRDGWLVGMFDGFNYDMWDRQPGDKLSFRQKIDIGGQIFTVLMIITMIIGLVVFLGLNADEWEPGRVQ